MPANISSIDALRWVLNAAELASAVTGFYCLKKLKGTCWESFPFFLLWIFCGEMTGKWLRMYDDSRNQILYSAVLMPSQFIYYYSRYYQYFKERWKKVFVLVLLMLYCVVVIAELSWGFESDYVFISVSYDLGVVFLLVLVLLGVFQLVSDEEILFFKSSMAFWVTLGLSIGYICTVPFYIWRKMLVLQQNLGPVLNTAFIIILLLNIFMYLLFITGFIRWKPMK